MAAKKSQAITGAMTVDVEDYFQVAAFANQVNRQDWDNYPCRVERNVDVILGMFLEQRVSATFFALGWIAERYPNTVRRIVDEGHELAAHGYDHVKVHTQTPEAFREDIRKTKRILEDLSGVAIKGYRAASFSVDQRTPWAFEVLAEEGYLYSSSVYPIRHDHYGMPEAPRFAHCPSAGHAIIEVPISTLELFSHNFPSGGGGYFRLLPYRCSRWALRRIAARDHQPVVFYFHPWEVDPDQPRFTKAAFQSRFRHYVNLGVMEQRLRAVLKDFSWDRMDRIFLAGKDSEACQASAPIRFRSVVS